MTTKQTTATILAALAVINLNFNSATAAEKRTSVPIGHADFYPTPERPIGFRGDGSGDFAGATPPIEWWDGTPVKREIGLMREYGEPGGGKPTLMWDHADAKSKNILWRVPTAGWGYSTPTVVGKRVYVQGNPYWVACYDAATGKELWKKAMTPFVAQGMEPAKAEALRKVYDLAHAIYLLGTGYDYSGSDFLVCAPTHFEKNDPAGFVAKRIASCDKALAMIAKYRGDVEAVDDPKLMAGLEADIAAITGIKTKMAAATTSPEAMKSVLTRLDVKVRNLHAALSAYKVGWGGSWYGYTGQADATLLSDGQRLYGTMSQGQTFCYDLDGNLVWARQDFPLDPQKTWHRPVQLLDGVLISRPPHRAPEFKGDDHVSSWRGYDPATGKILWEVPWGSLYCYGLPVVTRLKTTEGQMVGVFITPGGQGDKGQAVIRVTDGKVLGTLPKLPIGRGPHFSLHGDLLVSGGGGDGRAPDAWAMRLRMTGPETVVGDLVWNTPKEAGFRPSDLFPAWRGPWRIQGDHESGIRDVVAGKTVGPLPGFTETPTLVGDYLIGRTGWRGQARAMEGRTRADKKALDCYRVVDLSDPSRPRTLSDRNLIGYTDLPADHILNTYLAAWDLYNFANCYHAFPSYLGGDMAGVTAHGERIYINTVAYLYCIGPAVKGTPKDDPTVVAAIRAATSVDEVVKYLESESAQYRWEAVKKVGSGKWNVAEGKLEALANNDPYEEIRADALRALGLAADQPGFAILKQAIMDGIVVNNDSHTHQGLGDTVTTLRALGKAADPVLVALLTDPDSKFRRIGAAAAGLWPSGSEAVRDALIVQAADRSSEQAVRSHAMPATEALSNWPVDVAVTALFTKIVENDKDWQFHKPAVRYLMRALPEDQKNATLAKAAKAWSGEGNVALMLERGAYDSIKPLVIETKDRIQSGIVVALARAAAESNKPEHRKFAAEMGVLALKNPSTDMHALSGTIHWLRVLGADGAPLLPVLKAMKLDDANAAKAAAETIAEIEAKMAAAEKEKEKK